MLSKAERQTIITFSEDREEAAEVYTHNPILRARLAYMAAMYPQEVRWHSTQYDLAEGGERYIVSREWMIRALKGIKPERQPTKANTKRIYSFIRNGCKREYTAGGSSRQAAKCVNHQENTLWYQQQTNHQQARQESNP